MIQTIRVYWPKIQGRVTLNVALPGLVNNDSVVHVTACEAGNWTPQPNGTAKVSRQAGAADVYVMAVSPEPDRLEFVLKVDWKSPLDVITDITIMDPPTRYIYQGSVG